MENIKNIILDVPANEYHAASKAGKFLSSHLLGDFRSCPQLYFKKMQGEVKESESSAFTIGRAAHALILQGKQEFDREFMVSEGPVNPKTGNAYGRSTKAYAEWASGLDRDVISGEDFGFISKLQKSVLSHPFAAELLSTGFAEGTVRAEYAKEPCQIRMDFYNDRYGIIDLKTGDDLKWFESDFKRYGYGYQLAFYRAVLRVCLGKNVPCHVIAVEKREPYRCGVWKISTEALDFAEVENIAAIERLHECRKNSLWPTGYEDIRFIDSI
jgi:hypothetical protein